MKTKNRDAVQAFLKKHPEGSYSLFRQQMSVKMSDASFYYHKAQLVNSNGKENSKKELVPQYRGKLYHPIFRIPAVNDCSMKLLCDFCEALGKAKKIKLEVVQYANPKELEVREYR